MTGPAVLEETPWPIQATRLIKAYAFLGQEFTAEDIEAALGKPPHGSLMGNAFLKASEARLITMTGTKRSTTPSRKGGLIRTWAGTEKARTE